MGNQQHRARKKKARFWSGEHFSVQYCLIVSHRYAVRYASVRILFQARSEHGVASGAGSALVLLLKFCLGLQEAQPLDVARLGSVCPCCLKLAFSVGLGPFSSNLHPAFYTKQHKKCVMSRLRLAVKLLG